MRQEKYKKHIPSIVLRLLVSVSLTLTIFGLPIFLSAGADTQLFGSESFEATASSEASADAEAIEPVYTPFASSGSTNIYTLQGNGSGTANGDYITTTGGLNTVYRYFIEVPSGLSRLQVELFDADIGLGGTGEASAGRDRARSGFDTSATYSLIDPSGSSRTVRFSTGDTTLPTGGDNAWLTLYNGTGNNVLDNFSTAAYSNNNGNNNWATNWTEASDDGSATAGAIRITGGELRIQDGVTGTPSINREADLLGTPGLNLSVAYLSFAYRTSSNLEDSDQVTVQVSSNGGTSWTSLETFSNDSSGTRQYDITSFIANNTRVRFLTTDGGLTGTEFFFFDNVQIHDGGAVTAGHWELRIDMSSAVTTGDDINAIGIRAHDGTSGSGGTELNVYYDSHNGFGINPPASGTQSRSYEIYPYITSGCSCGRNDFDYDSNSGNTGSFLFTSRLGTFTQSYSSTSLSANDVWDRDTFSGWTTDSNSLDYGIWNADLTITTYFSGGSPSGNYTNFYMNNYAAAANPPTANPTANTFRIYLPADSGAAPVKPYLQQFVLYHSGSNPVTVGQTTTFTVTIQMVNPTSSAITFSSSNLVTSNVPGSGATYAGNATVSQGSIVSQPSIGGTGNVTWNPGTLASGGTAAITYRVNVAPTLVGQRVPVTATPASGNGTRATYVDETGNTTQSRATFTFGPICELAATEGTLSPTAVDSVDLTATAYQDGVRLEWKTGYETNNLGFNIYREENGQRTLINDSIVAGSALMAGAGTQINAGMHYSWWDSVDGEKDNLRYWIEDVDLDGAVQMHGPFDVETGSGFSSDKTRAGLLNAVGAGSTIQKQYTEPGDPSVNSKGSSRRSSRLAAAAALDFSGRRAVKLSIREEGWYRVSIADLIAAGLDPNFDPRYLQMFAGDKEQPLLVSGADGSVRNGAIEFYATGQNTPFTDARAYWVFVGNQIGTRVSLINAPGDGQGAGSFPFTLELRERTVYFAALRNGDAENFFGRAVSTTPASCELKLGNIDSTFAGNARLDVSLQGVTDPAGTRDHQVVVRINGNEVGRLMWDGQKLQAQSFSFAHSLLRDQANTVTLQSEGGAMDVSLVDYIRLTYQHTFTAENDSLKLSVGGSQTAEKSPSNPRLRTIGGFTSPLIRVLDITDQQAVKELAGRVTESGGKYAVTVETADTLSRTLLALTADRIRKPASITFNEPSSLKSDNNQADMIIITHRSLKNSVAALQKLRESQRLLVSVIDVEDIYDEFNQGEKSPVAIRDFLLTAKKSWKRAPRYLLIVGDASFDPKNYLNLTDADLVPTRLVDSLYLETASDDWLADFNSDGIADIAIGRLPVRTSSEADSLIAKIIAYEKSARDISTRGALLIADRNDGFDFEAASNQLRQLLPAGSQAQVVFRGKTDDASAARAISEAIESGQLLINYAGHGSTATWRGSLLTSQSARGLKNSTALSMFVTMTCLNGYFIDPSVESLGEALIASPQGGAIAVWSSSGLTDPRQQSLVNQELYKQLFLNKTLSPTIGEAVMRAKAATTNLDVRRTWILLGDPASRLK